MLNLPVPVKWLKHINFDRLIYFECILFLLDQNGIELSWLSWWRRKLRFLLQGVKRGEWLYLNTISGTRYIYRAELD